MLLANLRFDDSFANIILKWGPRAALALARPSAAKAPDAVAAVSGTRPRRRRLGRSNGLGLADQDIDPVGEMALPRGDHGGGVRQQLTRDFDPTPPLGTGFDIANRSRLTVLDDEELGDAGELDDRIEGNDGRLGQRRR